MLVSKAKYDQLEIDKQHAYALLDESEATVHEQALEIEELKEKVKSFEDAVATAEAEQTSASFYVSDDIQEVKPITRVSTGIVNKLVESGYLSSNKRNDEFSLNLAVLVLVSEALEQIVFSFEQEVNDGDDDSDLWGEEQ